MYSNPGGPQGLHNPTYAAAFVHDVNLTLIKVFVVNTSF